MALSPSAPMGLWGYSGGGLATAWAAETSGTYAPELNIVGAVLGSPVGDLGHAFRRLNGSLYAGLPAMVVAALSHVYPELDRIISQHATDEGKAMLLRVQNMTTALAVLRLNRMDMGKLVDRPLDEILDMPEVRQVFDSIKLGTAAPAPPATPRKARALLSAPRSDSTRPPGSSSALRRRTLVSGAVTWRATSSRSSTTAIKRT